MAQNNNFMSLYEFNSPCFLTKTICIFWVTGYVK